MTDPWGVPDNMLEPADDDFAGALSRVAMLSALLENSVDNLFMALDYRPQETFAGSGIGNGIGRLRTILNDDIAARPDVDVPSARHPRCP